MKFANLLGVLFFVCAAVANAQLTEVERRIDGKTNIKVGSTVYNQETYGSWSATQDDADSVLGNANSTAGSNHLNNGGGRHEITVVDANGTTSADANGFASSNRKWKANSTRSEQVKLQITYTGSGLGNASGSSAIAQFDNKVKIRMDIYNQLPVYKCYLNNVLINPHNDSRFTAVSGGWKFQGGIAVAQYGVYSATSMTDLKAKGGRSTYVTATVTVPN